MYNYNIHVYKYICNKKGQLVHICIHIYIYVQVYIYIFIYVRGWELWGTYSSDTLNPAVLLSHGASLCHSPWKQISESGPPRTSTMETPFPKKITLW